MKLFEMMKYTLTKLLIISVALCLTSCATIVDAINGSKAKLSFEGNIDTPVSIQTKDSIYLRRHEIGCHLGIGASVDKGRMRKMEDYLEKNLGYEQGFLCGYLGAASIGLHYSYYLSRKWAIGFNYAYAAGRSNPYWKYDDLNPSDDAEGCDVLVRSHLLMPSVKHLWWEDTKAAIYTKAALGLQYRRLFYNFYDEEPEVSLPEDKSWKLAYQFSAVGVEFGSSWLRAYFELGYGNEGVVLLGLRTRF